MSKVSNEFLCTEIFIAKDGYHRDIDQEMNKRFSTKVNPCHSGNCPERIAEIFVAQFIKILKIKEEAKKIRKCAIQINPRLGMRKSISLDLFEN